MVVNKRKCRGELASHEKIDCLLSRKQGIQYVVINKEGSLMSDLPWAFHEGDSSASGMSLLPVKDMPNVYTAVSP
jgi:hypothetical protein